MKARTYSIIEFKRILENNGYHFLRHAKGDHCIYSNGVMVNALSLLRGLM